MNHSSRRLAREIAEFFDSAPIPEDIPVTQDSAPVPDAIVTSEAPCDPDPKPAPKTLEDVMVAIMLAETIDLGPMQTTGGVVHKITEADARVIAPRLVTFGALYGLDPLDLLAGIQGESKADARAVNPNHQDAKPGESEHDAFLHTDLGLGQFDGATLAGIPEFAGFTDAQIEAKAYDPKWATSYFVELVAKISADTLLEIAADATLLDGVPNHDERVLVYEAYNAGVHGAAEKARAKGDFSYGTAWLARSEKYIAKAKAEIA